MSIQTRSECEDFDKFQDLHVIYECKAGLLKLGKTTHTVCFAMEMHSFHLQDMPCCSDVDVVQS